MFMFAGHYHRGPWYHQEDGVNYFVFPGTSMVKTGPLGWAIFDVYPDRVEYYYKSPWLGYEPEGVTEFYHYPYMKWDTYEEHGQHQRTGKTAPLTPGPMTIQRSKGQGS